MNQDMDGTVIDMTPDGQFRALPKAGAGLRLTGIAVLAAISLGVILSLALAVWLAVTLVPVVIVVTLIGLFISRLGRGPARP